MSHFIVYLCSFERGSIGFGYFQFDFIFTETCPQSSLLRQVKGDIYTLFGKIEEFGGREENCAHFYLTYQIYGRSSPIFCTVTKMSCDD